MNIVSQILCVLLLWYASFAHGSTFDLVSSVLWAKDSKMVYFPGLRSVLNTELPREEFRIEFYVAEVVDGSSVSLELKGPFIDSSEYIDIDEPICSSLPVTIDADKQYGFQCYIDFVVSSSLPSGLVSLQVLINDGLDVVRHPNLFYVLIAPERDVINHVVVKRPDPVTDDQPPHIVDIDTEAVVQISFPGNASLGTGFIVRGIDSIKRLFGGVSLDFTGTYVLSAAHIFPMDRDPGRQDFPHQLYNLKVKDQGIPKALNLVYWDISSDLALFRVASPSKQAEVRAVFGRDSFGIPLASGRGLLSCVSRRCKSLMVLGYPVSKGGTLQRKLANLTLDGLPTDDTSNFGSSIKFKVAPASHYNVPLAEPGMSGGPIINHLGQAVGVAIEKPVDANELIGVMFSGDYREVVKDKDCHLIFNPSSRILSLRNRSLGCNYGRMGSPSLESVDLLEGDWQFQEVFSVGSESAGSYNLVGGHTVVNGYGVINGHGIIRRERDSGLFIVHEGNIEEVNSTVLSGGYQFDSKSFRASYVGGVRVIRAPGLYSFLQGKLITAYRDEMESDFRPVYSLREFVRWLHIHSNRDELPELIKFL